MVIDQESGTISVENDGRGIPVVIHDEHQVYIPEMIFGQLLTSTNYDDTRKKVTGGRNGYGAKLTNIFSKEFTIETSSKETGHSYSQTWTDNMSQKQDAIIGKAAKKDFTRVTFRPDFSRFKMTHLDDDTVGLMSKRVYDMAGVTDSSVKVWLNGEKLRVNTFADYVDMYLNPDAGGAEEEKSDFSDDDDESDWEDGGSKAKKKQKDKEPEARIFAKLNDRWEICATVSDGQFQQVSFVNAICTTKGGQHVNYITDQLTAAIVKTANKGRKGVQVKPHHVKNHLRVFVKCLIENPAFDSQTKETLTTRPKSFGSTASVPDKFIKAVAKCGVVDNILQWARFKETAELKRKGGAKKSKLAGIPKLDDANYAGGARGKDCTLILTEGDSAKALAISGLSVVGRDYFGVFPLKGKLLNVREATHKQILGNAEIQNIVNIMGLKFGTTYEDTKSLRYGHILIMADQDHDGSHIKGLVINFIHHFWPSLLRIEGFMQEFITPIVKCTKGKKTECFFTVPEYHEWLEAHNGGKGWSMKYYKGLGTSTSKEAKEYFADIATHRIRFLYEGPPADDTIDLAFSKKRVSDRKRWLRAFVPGTHVDYDVEAMHYSEFVNKELILFSRADNVRSIPSVVDGMKPSQRKVLFSCFKRKLVNEIKVAQLAGYVSEHSAYHHGEVSLAGTIVGMAQDFVGSNNINLLVPSGQFGTRHMAGKDAASPRYIFTKLAAVARAVFHEADDAVLEYQDEDGQVIEPEWYMPVIPLVLVNGADGIGTGWSSQVPTYNPRDIINNLRAMLAGEAPTEMSPWFRGFSGIVSKKDDNTFHVRGTFERDGDKVVISELPVRRATQDYKTFLESIMVGGPSDTGSSKASKASKAKKGAKSTKTTKAPTLLVKEFKENHTDTTVSFTLKLTPEGEALSDSALRKALRLDSTVSKSNMHLFDAAGLIRKYNSELDILSEFFELRMDFYKRRKAHLLGQLTDEWVRLDNRMRFIQMVVNEEISVGNRSKADLMAELKSLDFKLIMPKSKKDAATEADAAEEDDEDDGPADVADMAKGYNYLLSMPIWSLTQEKVDKLRAEVAAKKAELDELRATAPEQMWETDLEMLEIALDDVDGVMAANAAAEAKARRAFTRNGKGTGKGAARKARAKAKKGSDYDDSSDESDFEVDEDFKPAPRKAPARARRATAKATPKQVEAEMTSSDEDDAALDEDSDFDDAEGAAVAKPPVKASKVSKPSKPSKTAKRPAAVAPAPVPVAPAKVESESESDGEMMSLADRLAKRVHVTPKKEEAAPKPRRAARAASKPVVVDSDSEIDLLSDSEDDAAAADAAEDDDFDELDLELSPEPKKTTKRPPKRAKASKTPEAARGAGSGKARAAKKARPRSTKKAGAGAGAAADIVDDGADDVHIDDIFAAEPEDKPAKKTAKPKKAAPKNAKAPAAKPKAKKAAKKKSAVVLSESEDEFDLEDTDESEEEGPVKPKTPRARRAAASKVTYAFDSEAEEESESDFDDAGSDDSDFDM